MMNHQNAKSMNIVPEKNFIAINWKLLKRIDRYQHITNISLKTRVSNRWIRTSKKKKGSVLGNIHKWRSSHIVVEDWLRFVHWWALRRKKSEKKKAKISSKWINDLWKKCHVIDTLLRNYIFPSWFRMLTTTTTTTTKWTESYHETRQQICQTWKRIVVYDVLIFKRSLSLRNKDLFWI